MRLDRNLGGGQHFTTQNIGFGHDKENITQHVDGEYKYFEKVRHLNDDAWHLKCDKLIVKQFQNDRRRTHDEKKKRSQNDMTHEMPDEPK